MATITGRGLRSQEIRKSDLLSGSLTSAAEQFAEKLEIQQTAPNGAVDFEGLAISLSDTLIRIEFFSKL